LSSFSQFLQSLDDDQSWTRRETLLLFDLVSKEQCWESIAQTLGKTTQQCVEWFDYLEYVSKHLPKRQKPKNNTINPRKRRKAAQIERLYKCQEKYCSRSYGTEGALKMHIKLKHPNVTYNEAYQQQARRASVLLSQQFEEDEEEDQDTISSVFEKRDITNGGFSQLIGRTSAAGSYSLPFSPNEREERIGPLPPIGEALRTGNCVQSLVHSLPSVNKLTLNGNSGFVLPSLKRKLSINDLDSGYLQ